MTRCRPTSRGITLIEAVVVIAVVAVIAGGAAVSLRGAARSARIEDVAERCVAFDRSTRELARRLGRTPALRFELSRGGGVARVEEGREATPLALGGDVRVTAVVIRGAGKTSGTATVPFSGRGQTPTYAVRLAGPAGERWVVFAGLTGQALVLTDERDVRDILSAATQAAGAGGRADAR